jgi:hypothetical protein
MFKNVNMFETFVLILLTLYKNYRKFVPNSFKKNLMLNSGIYCFPDYKVPFRFNYYLFSVSSNRLIIKEKQWNLLFPRL